MVIHINLSQGQRHRKGYSEWVLFLGGRIPKKTDDWSAIAYTPYCPRHAIPADNIEPQTKIPLTQAAYRKEGRPCRMLTDVTAIKSLFLSLEKYTQTVGAFRRRKPDIGSSPVKDRLTCSWCSLSIRTEQKSNKNKQRRHGVCTGNTRGLYTCGCNVFIAFYTCITIISSKHTMCFILRVPFWIRMSKSAIRVHFRLQCV